MSTVSLARAEQLGDPIRSEQGYRSKLVRPRSVTLRARLGPAEYPPARRADSVRQHQLVVQTAGARQGPLPSLEQ